MNEFPFFDPSLLVFNAQDLGALLPYLWLCFGIVLTTIGGALGWRNRRLRDLLLFALVPFIVLLLKDLKAESLLVFGDALELNPSVRLAGASLALMALLAMNFMKSSDQRRHGE